MDTPHLQHQDHHLGDLADNNSQQQPNYNNIHLAQKMLNLRERVGVDVQRSQNIDERFLKNMRNNIDIQHSKGRTELLKKYNMPDRKYRSIYN